MTSRLNGTSSSVAGQAASGAHADRARSTGSDHANIDRSTAVAHDATARSTSVDQELQLLRDCCRELGWTLDALEAHMGVGRAYIGKVLSGDKPFRLEFEVTLPWDVRAEYRKRQAEQFGLVVVRPLTGADAQMAFVAGALGLLASGLPTRASAMAKADLSVAQKAVNE